MPDKFHSLTLKEAIAVQIFYTSPEDENLHGKILNSENWAELIGSIETVSFHKTGGPKDEELEKLIESKSYKEILEKYDNSGATFEVVVIYKKDGSEFQEMNLSDAIESTFSPEELPSQIIEFLLQKEEFSFLKG
ncbi:MAG TPA: hypothetical protein VK809_07075 [Bacteroidia bacterium]|jgi:hypothetical protein|nr:hypothetical protein [Bacteroidia bacterium]